jgi:pimeloyl-ACP methyl ester carboxylesterase
MEDNMESVYRTPEGKNKILARYEEILAYWPVPHEMRNVSTAFGDTFVIACGADTGKAVILLHGSAANSAMWMGDVMTLGKTRRVYAVDIIGEPGKSAESRPDPAGTNYGQWLAQVMDGLGLKQAAVVGNSLGGWMAVSLASYAPERVESLVLIASGGLSPLRATFMLKTFLYYMMGANGVAKQNRLVYGDIDIPEEALAFGRLVGENFIPRTKGYGALPDSAFHKLGMPVLYFGGDRDVLLPTKKNAARLKRLVPQADVRVLEGRPHALIGLADEIAEFLEGAAT